MPADPPDWLDDHAITVYRLDKELKARSRFQDMVQAWLLAQRRRREGLTRWRNRREKAFLKHGMLGAESPADLQAQSDPTWVFETDEFRFTLSVPPDEAGILRQNAQAVAEWAQKAILKRPSLKQSSSKPRPRGWQSVGVYLALGALIPPELASDKRPDVSGVHPLAYGPERTLEVDYAVLAAIHDACREAIERRVGEPVEPIISESRTDPFATADFVSLRVLGIPELGAQEDGRLIREMLENVRADLERRSDRKQSPVPLISSESGERSGGNSDPVLEFRTKKAIARFVERDSRTIRNWENRGLLKIEKLDGMYLVRESQLKACDSGPRRKA